MTDKAKELRNKPINPCSERVWKSAGIASSWETVNHIGLTKREYFAGLAMQGILCEKGLNIISVPLAREAVNYADALLEELSKTEQDETN